MGSLEFVNFSLAAGRLVERIRQYKPDVVITFGGDGGQNTHPDHMMVSMLTTAAFHWSGQAKRYPECRGARIKDSRLYYVTANFHMPDRQPAMPMPWTVTLDIRSVTGTEDRGVSEACFAGSADGEDEGDL